jgi:hypothetical protein
MSKRKPCTVCGTTQGPNIFGGDPQCSVNCKKFASGEYTEASFIIFSGKIKNPETGYYDLDMHKEQAKKGRNVTKRRRGMSNTIL